MCPPCTNKPSNATYQGTSLTPVCPWVCDSMYGGPTCAACGKGYWCLYGAMNKCPYNSISPLMSFSQNNCTCMPGYSSQGSNPGTSPCIRCQTGMICPGGQAAAPVVSKVPLANITQAIMVQKPLPTVNSFVSLLLSIPNVTSSLLKSVSTSGNVKLYTRQVCRSSYCVNCDRSSVCVGRVTVGVSIVNGAYRLNVSALSYDVIYTFTMVTTGGCAPTFSLSAEYVTGSMVALTSLTGLVNVSMACATNANLNGSVAVYVGSTSTGRRRLLQTNDTARPQRKLLQINNDTLAVDFVVPPNETSSVNNAIESQNLTIQGYTSTVPAPPLMLSCPNGSSSGEGSSSLADCACLPGYEGNASNGSDCILCRNGTYCESGRLSLCPENAYSAPGSDSFFNCSCRPGFYGNTTCTQCPENAFCPGGMPIYNCTPKAIAPVQSTGPGACYCDRGYYGVANVPCQGCENGTWCWTGIRNVCPLYSTSAELSNRITDCGCDDGHEAIMGVDSFGRDTRVCNLCGEATFCKVRWPETYI